MKDNENLSVDEILREADKMLRQIDKKSTNESIKADKDIEEIKTFTPVKSNKGNFDINIGEVSDKTRPVAVSEKTRPVTISDKTIVNKKHYFEHSSSDDAYRSEPPKIIEKSATIRSKSRFNKTSDLQEIPTILAVEELERTRMIFNGEPVKEKVSSENDYDLSDQIKISGFDDEVDEIPSIDEDVAEAQLRQRREDKINKFRLFAKEEVDGNTADEAQRMVKEDTNNSDRTKTLEQFYKRKTKLQTEIVITAIIGTLLLLLTVFKDSHRLPYIFGTDNGYYITTLVLYGLLLIFNVDIIIHGLNFRRGINFDFPVTVSVLLILGHTSALLLNPDLLFEGGAVYPAVAAFAMFFSGLGKRSMIMRIIHNFAFLTDGEDKYSVEDIVNEVDATIISRNLLAGDPLLKYSVKTDYPTSFLEISCAYEPADKTAKILSPVMIVLNLILFAVIGFMQENWYFAFNVLTAGIIISCPIVSIYASNLSLRGVSRSLAERGAMVCGFEGAHVTHKSNALVMEASDLFGVRSCDLHGIRLFNKTKVDDALLLTAAIIMKTKSPLAHVFDDVIVGKQAILPEVDGVIYEDKMGTSAWIYQKKVLVGNRDLLIRHGISVPKEDYESKYAKNGRKALYLAVAGKISAMFVVSYSADSDLKRELKKLEKSGITILLKSCDPYINEESIMEIFGLPEGFVRVMTSSNARVFEKYSDMVVEKSPAYTVHDGSALGFISAIRGSENLIGTENMLSVLVSFGSAIGFGVVALLGLLNGMSQINAINVIIFQMIWSIFVLIISKIRRSGI